MRPERAGHPADRDAVPGATGEPERGRSVVRDGGGEHVAQLVLVLGRHHEHLREDPEVRQVEDPVVGRPVRAHQAAAVEHEHDREVHKTDIVEDLIVGTLEKGRVDRYHRALAAGCEAGRERDRVLLADPDVEEAFGDRLGEEVKAGPLRHRGRDRHDARVLPGELDERLREDLGVRRRAGLLLCHLPGFDRERRGAVPEDGVRLRRLVPLALARDHVDEHGVVRVLVFAQGGHQLRHGVTVDRTYVLEPQLLEEYPRHDQLFGHVLGLLGELQHALAHLRDGQEETLNLVLQATVGLPVNDPV
jgi:hypothetical protein